MVANLLPPTTEVVQVSDDVDIARQTLQSLTPGDAAYFNALSDFSDKLFNRFNNSGNPSDLDEVVMRKKELLELTTSSHPSYLAVLSNMGAVLRRRFKLREDVEDLTDAIDCFEAASKSCTPEHPLHLGIVANLASGLLNRYWCYGDIPALDRIIHISSTALAAGSSEDRNRDSLLNNYATALKERFQQQGNRADLDMALQRYQDCLDLRPLGHPLRHTLLTNLADAMLVRFEADSDMQDLESAAHHYVDALQLCPPHHPGYLLNITSLGVTFWYSWIKGGDPQKLEMAIGCYSTALALSTVPNLDRVRILDNYGAALVTRHFQSENLDDLNQAIEYLTTSLSIQPSGFTGRHITRLHLGIALFTRFNTVGNIADLDAAIGNLASALESCPLGHQDRHSLLSSYGRALSIRFEEKGDEKDLTLATLTCKEALTVVSPRASTYQVTVANLTSTMLVSLRVSSHADEYQNIIDLCESALAAPHSLSQPDLITLKSNRARSFFEKFKAGREQRDIDIAVNSFRELMALPSEEHTEYIPVRIELAIALETRFQLTAQQEDLDEAIALFRIVYRRSTPGKINYVQSRMELGNALRVRFDTSSDAVDALDEAIVLLSEAEEALASTPGNYRYKICLVNLGGLLFMRYEVQKRRADLDDAIEHTSNALRLSASSEDFLVQCNLAAMLSTRSTLNEDLVELRQTIALLEASWQQMPPKHLNRAQLCRSYGRALLTLSDYDDRDPIRHLNSAIALFGESIKHLPESHSDQPLTLISLSYAYYRRFLFLKDDEGLLKTKEILGKLLQMIHWQDDHPLSHVVHQNAALIHLRMYERFGSKEPGHLEESITSYEKAARYTHSHGHECVRVGLDWVSVAETHGHPSILRAYQTTLSSLNNFLLMTPSVKSRHAIFLDQMFSQHATAGSLATNATSCALDQGHVELAVELSEQGRGLLWSQLSRIRTPLDSLRSADEEGKALASEFERIASQLASSAVPHHETTITWTRLSVEEAAQRYRQLTSELDAVVAQIQAKEGFQAFLGRMSFHTLRSAAAKGPVVLINISRKRCDAIIILHDEAPRLIPLPDATIDDITSMSTDFYQSLKATSRLGEEKLRERQIVPILRNLWEVVVSPIVDELSKFLPRGSRVWWCPTSKLTPLPIHAAGPYRKGSSNLSNIYISSYTPTLTALIRARSEKATKMGISSPALIAIGQSKPADFTGEAELKAVDSELSLVRSLLPASVPFDHLSGPTSTADAAMDALREHSWVHLACHGNQDFSQPFDSSFALGDRPLTLLDIVRADLRHPEFAFLSACHTAVGDSHTPDEIIHLAAGMQFSGFRSVIGTMWAVDDEMAQTMVREFYKNMFAGGKVDCTNAARALNKASKTMEQGLSFDQRIVFIHIGA